MDTSRREFLKALAYLASSGLTGVCFADGSQAKETEEPKANYQVLPWSGDNFTLGHQMRDGKLPKFPDKADETCDFVIVGGGMAGLCCAHFLKGQDFVLLEQYANTGGTSSGASFNGIDYSMGAVCTGKHENDLGAQLFEDLNIKPVVISPEQTAWHSGGHWYKTVNGADSFHKELKRLQQQIEDTSKSTNASPDQARMQTSELDDVPFSNFLSGYDRDFVGLVNNTCRSFFCSSPDSIAASAGFFMIRALTSDSYVFNGGNSGIARALRSDLDKADPKRVRTSCFVWSVQKTERGAAIIYSDSSGEVRRIDCKHVVVATPPVVAARIVPELPTAMRNTFKSLEYGSFLVANFCMRKKVLDQPYQSFADEPCAFGQMTMAEAPYEAAGTYKPEMGSVLTVYRPFESGSKGRYQLLATQRTAAAGEMIEQLTRLFEPFQSNLVQVNLTRWGHAGVTPRPGIAKQVQQINEQQTDWMTFAHSTATGAASFGGAVRSGKMAADRCLKKA